MHRSTRFAATTMTAAAVTGVIAGALLSTTALADVMTQAQTHIHVQTFTNEGATLRGTLYLPENHDGTPLPVVIVTGAWTSVEEQMPKTYAEAMVERGFAAFTFDFRGWGKSGDLAQGVRYREDPAAKISDIKAAIAHVSGLDALDVASIHGLGICASAGYMLDASVGNPAVTRVGLVAPWLQDRALVEAVYGGAEGVDGLIGVSRRAAAEGGQIIPAAGPEGAEGVLMPIGGYYHDPARGAIAAYDNRWDQASWEGWLSYHPADHAAAFDKPLAVVHSEAAAIPDGLRRFLDAFTGEATERWLEDVTQFDFYDDPKHVARAADAMATHFAAH
ncbi:MAG: alpha/beta hydrolase [Pseudomonadota bacterium]